MRGGGRGSIVQGRYPKPQVRVQMSGERGVLGNAVSRAPSFPQDPPNYTEQQAAAGRAGEEFLSSESLGIHHIPEHLSAQEKEHGAGHWKIWGRISCQPF